MSIGNGSIVKRKHKPVLQEPHHTHDAVRSTTSLLWYPYSVRIADLSIILVRPAASQQGSSAGRGEEHNTALQRGVAYVYYGIPTRQKFHVGCSSGNYSFQLTHHYDNFCGILRHSS
jgi:hypothetical protein